MKDFLDVPRPSFTFEIFPPKGTSDLSGIYGTIDALASLSPDLISVTYGAGGSSRDNTVEIASAIQNHYDLCALAHLTCVGSTREELDKVLQELWQKGVRHLLALRGDLKDPSELGDFKHASELISHIRQHYHFRILAACYPEKHLEAYSMAQDLQHLKEKVDCGADALISQLFFDNDAFFRFLDLVRALGITVPVIAGVMPITSAQQIDKIVRLCGASVPLRVQNFVRAYSHNAMALREAGIAYATEQIVDLLARGVDGIHIYSMNQPSVTQKIAENLRGILYSLRVKRD